jgi:signal transduction histidine kinase
VRRPRSRLAVRIYVAGLAQIAAVVLGFGLLVRLRVSSDRQYAHNARASVEAVAAHLGDGAAVARELDRLAQADDAAIEIYDETGRVLATNRRPGEDSSDPAGDPRRLLPDGPPFEPPGGHPRPPPDLGPPGLFPPPPGPLVPAFMMPVRLPDGHTGRALYGLRHPHGLSRDVFVILTFVLVVVGVASLVTARGLARPLAELSRTARAIGSGRLDARVGMTRSDEIGEVAAAFDEMAERVAVLLRAEKELLANVSHELRTPLARIRVALDLAAEGDADTARVAVGEIAEDLAELERLIGDILTAARLDVGSDGSAVPPLRLERIDVGELLERAASRFRSAHPSRPLEVRTATGSLALEGDPVLLRRVVDNLLENAHRYAKGPEDGVELESRGGPHEIVIEVRDHGIGIAAEDLPLVFRPFFRADRSRARATGGLGLGLALARRIVEAHHGAIELESTLGHGTRALVHLPVER